MFMDITDSINYEKYNVDVQKRKLEKINLYLANNPKDIYAIRKKENILRYIKAQEEQIYNLEQIEKILPAREDRQNPFEELMTKWA